MSLTAYGYKWIILGCPGSLIIYLEHPILSNRLVTVIIYILKSILGFLLTQVFLTKFSAFSCEGLLIFLLFLFIYCFKRKLINFGSGYLVLVISTLVMGDIPL